LPWATDGLLDLGGFNLVSLGWSNVTPWHTNRECTEEVLVEKLTVVHESADPSRTIFNIHVPPYDCGLDRAPRLDDSLQIQLEGGQPDMIPVGSTAVGDSIAAYQPLLSLHGHIHEGRGTTKNGRTLVVNPGSEYDQGSLLGALIEVKPGKVSLIPYKQKDLYATSPIAGYLGRLPKLTIIGLLGALGALLMVLNMARDPFSGVDVNASPVMFWVSIGMFPLGIALYYLSGAVRRREGVNLGLAFREIPPE
jgi:hypothetical protein